MKHDPRTEAGLHLSLSEISALSARATRGAGRNWGEAEEAAEAACWLARAGLDWAIALLQVLEAPNDEANCALRAGMLLADTAACPETIAVPKGLMSCPCFVLPFVARMVELTRQRTLLEWGDTRVVLAPGEAPRLDGPVRIAGRAEVKITPVTHDSTPCPNWPQTHRGAVTASQYARLMKLMMAFTVPSSASSLAGAGALGDDND
jgi:hypothetical protein